MEIYEFNPVIYPYKLWIVLDKDPRVIQDEFDEYSGKPIERIEEDTMMSEAFTMPVMKKGDRKFGVTIFFRSKRSMQFELVSHESSHAAKYLFEHVGADIAPHEPFEYVVGWISSCIGRVKAGKEVPILKNK